MYFYLYIQERLKTKEFLTPTISQLHHYSNWMNVKMQGSSNFESLFKGTSHLWTKITFNLVFRNKVHKTLNFGKYSRPFRTYFQKCKYLNACSILINVNKCLVKSKCKPPF